MILKMFERFIKKQSFHVIAKTLTNYDNSFNKNKCIINSKKEQMYNKWKSEKKSTGKIKKATWEFCFCEFTQIVDCLMLRRSEIQNPEFPNMFLRVLRMFFFVFELLIFVFDLQNLQI